MFTFLSENFQIQKITKLVKCFWLIILCMGLCRLSGTFWCELFSAENLNLVIFELSLRKWIYIRSLKTSYFILERFEQRK